jgi:hypothetical protein
MLVLGRVVRVSPTPFALTVGTAHTQTLILPKGSRPDGRFEEIGHLTRREPEKVVVGYKLDTSANTPVPELVDNPWAGRERSFLAFRLKGAGGPEVTMRTVPDSAGEKAD